MNFFKCLANDWTGITDLSSSGSEFHKQLPLNLMDLCPRELYVCSQYGQGQLILHCPITGESLNRFVTRFSHFFSLDSRIIQPEIYATHHKFSHRESLKDEHHSEII